MSLFNFSLPKPKSFLKRTTSDGEDKKSRYISRDEFGKFTTLFTKHPRFSSSAPPRRQGTERIRNPDTSLGRNLVSFTVLFTLLA